jgi:hypothetical protein
VGFPDDFYIIHEYIGFVNAFLKVFIKFLAKRIFPAHALTILVKNDTIGKNQ